MLPKTKEHNSGSLTDGITVATDQKRGRFDEIVFDPRTTFFSHAKPSD